MNRESTFLIKAAIVAVAIAAVAVSVVALPAIAARDAAAHPELAWQRYPFLGYAYVQCGLFLAGLYHLFRLLTFIDNNQAVSEASVRALRNLKYAAIAITTLMVAGIVTLMVMSAGQGDDITGVVAPALVITFGSAVVATVAAVRQKQVQMTIGRPSPVARS